MQLDTTPQDPDDVRLSETQLRDLAARLGDPEDAVATDLEVATAFQRMGA